MKTEDLLPNMDAICRLCLKENGGTVNVFLNSLEDVEVNHAKLSIPMRIMACAALEVQTEDGLPKKICTECRFQLEKSYLFRKQSQASDSKLRKHLRLLSLGKTSKVFQKKLDNDDDGEDDEDEFHDSQGFIKRHEEKAKIEEKIKLKALETKWKMQNQIELEKLKVQIKAECKKELEADVVESVQIQLRQQMQEELEKEITPKLKIECYEEARKSIREEVVTECRQMEMKALLEDLQTYLNEKRMLATHPLSDNVPVTQKKLKLDTAGEIKKTEEGSGRNRERTKSQSQTLNDVKAELISGDNHSDMGAHGNDEDGDSDNFFIYDTDEGFEIQKKSEPTVVDVNEAAFIQEYECGENQLNNQNNAKSSAISFRIQETENSEITFFKKTSGTITVNGANADIDDGQSCEPNIMVINYPDEIDDEEHLEMIDFTDDDDGPNKDSGQQGKEMKLKYTCKTESATADDYNTVSVVRAPDVKFYVSHVQRTYDTPKSFECTECPMMFSTQHSLDRHLKIHRREGLKNQCPECHIVVSCSSALRRHMFIHCEQKPFPCLECGKSFVQKEILKRHMQIHTGVKPHKCPHCDRAFAQRINLRQHINRHHMAEPRILQHSCHLCPKRFNHASGLSRHLASHNGVAFQCSECDRTFGDRSSIKRHIVNKHGNGKIAKSEKQVDNN